MPAVVSKPAEEKIEEGEPKSNIYRKITQAKN